MMDLVQLKSFAEVVERGTIAAAAVAQGYTAPAVSQHIAKLESDLGARLFDRVRGRLTPTARGVALLPIAFDMLDLDARGRAVANEPGSISHVVIAGFASAIATVLVPSLTHLRQNASVEVVEAEDADALRELSLGDVDIVLTQEYESELAGRHRRFTYTPIVTDRLILVLPPDTPVTTTIEQLADAQWLLNGRATRCAQATMRVLADRGVTPRIVGTVADNTALLALVASGHGVTVVPARVVDHDKRDVTVAQQDLGVTRTIHAVTRTATNPTLSPIVDLLCETAAPRHGDNDVEHVQRRR